MTTFELHNNVAVLQDLRLQSFDSIRFASYRTASKLRYIQKSTNRKFAPNEKLWMGLIFRFALQFIWWTFGM